jgi:uncharacterized protein (TIGR03067 family)
MHRLFASLVFTLALTPVAHSGGGEQDGKMIVGTWLTVTAELAGKEFPEELRKSIKLVLAPNTYIATVGKESDEGTCKWDSAKKPKEVDITSVKGRNKGKTFLAIYELNGDTLRVCYDLSGKARPTEFKTTPGTSLYLVTYRREKP